MYPSRFQLASFLGHRRNSLATSVSSLYMDVMYWQLHYLIQAVNIRLVHVINMSFPAVRTGLSGNCLLQILVLKWSRSYSNKIIAYTSTIEQLLLKWNGDEFNISMQKAIGFYYCHVTTFWNLICTSNILATEVTVLTRVSCQAISLGMRVGFSICVPH